MPDPDDTTDLVQQYLEKHRAAYARARYNDTECQWPAESDHLRYGPPPGPTVIEELTWHAARAVGLMVELRDWRRAEAARAAGLGFYRPMHRDALARLPKGERLLRREIARRVPQPEDVWLRGLVGQVEALRKNNRLDGGRPVDPVMHFLWQRAPELLERDARGFIVSDGDIARTLMAAGVIDGPIGAARERVKKSRQRIAK